MPFYKIAAAVLVTLLATYTRAGDSPPVGAEQWVRHGRRYALITSPYHCGNRQIDPLLASTIDSEREALERGVGVSFRPLSTRPELYELVEKADPRPLVILYVGHARKNPTRSQTELCMREGPVIVDDLLARMYRGIAYAVLILDACESAQVDVRKSSVPAAVLSASPFLAPIARNGLSSLGELLVPAFQCADLNQDGWVDDRELVDALWREVKQRGLRDTARPRLRRQAWSALPIATSGQKRNCPAVDGSPVKLPDEPAVAQLVDREQTVLEAPVHSAFYRPSVYWVVDATCTESVQPGAGELVLTVPAGQGKTGSGCGGSLSRQGGWAQRVGARFSTSEGFALVRRGEDLALIRLRDAEEMAPFPVSEQSAVVSRVGRGRWATVRYVLNDRFVWHGGAVEDPIEALDGTRLSGAQAESVWCQSPAFGQCFRIRPAQPGGGTP